MSAILIALFPFVLFVIVLILARIARKTAKPPNADPACGKCGYCVRGLAELTCPECGSDLREVGILAPGLRKPTSTPMRLFAWTALAAGPALVFALVGASYLAPWQAVATRNRAIFIQSPTIMETIQVQQQGRRKMIGRPRYNEPVPLQTMTLSLRSPRTSDDMTVDLATGAARYADTAGKTITGAFDASFIAAWLNANGVADSTVPQRAIDVLAAIDDMKTNGGGGFRNFSPNRARGNLPDVIAHPASPAYVAPMPSAITPFVPFALGLLLWAGGLPLVLRHRGGTRRDPRSRVESPPDANEK
ncbi:MAG: hypothetical protein QOF78_3693 [Phycisphaerales bacterium]|jgi:hypothetical protein|nr:hypothetical protein [Phycisphaerales bacterium]